jgi:hypothetical protein
LVGLLLTVDRIPQHQRQRQLQKFQELNNEIQFQNSWLVFRSSNSVGRMF